MKHIERTFWWLMIAVFVIGEWLRALAAAAWSVLEHLEGNHE